MNRLRVFTGAALLLCAATRLAGAAPPPAVTTMDQGTTWTAGDRAAYYSTNQGSRIMPLAWMKALKQPDGTPFLADGLARYGYLPNIADPSATLPVGFTTDGPAGQEAIGMTCAACHTRQIDVAGTAYRIDGGPAVADFGAFMADLDKAVGALLADPNAFAAFAQAVPGGTPAAALHQQVADWYKPYHTIVTGALPPKPWGPARLDAVGMIFNRLTGLDIGTAPDSIIAANIHIADSPVRYPFLWNASRQDQTQWPGFAANGDALLALARNTGEVIGVFAEFHPFQEAARLVLKVNYSVNEEDKTVNSANMDGLLTLEDLIGRIGPPKYIWPVDANLATQGAAIFSLPASQGGCAECHSAGPGKHRLFEPVETWTTPVQDVGTDNRQWTMIGVPGQAAFPGWSVDTGVLNGAEIPYLIPKLKPTDSAFNTLRMAVIGSILQRIPDIARFTVMSENNASFFNHNEQVSGVHTQGAAATELFGAFNRTATPTQAARPFKFESRVLHGIWATAPYLHNGSVPTLADLLNTQAQRPKSFKIGPAYDVKNLGLAAEQTKFNYTLTTTGCDDRTSGTSNCGHEFGTSLTQGQKAALLEYLKTL
jgi:mono/diheme cytochrome c family protein